MSENLMKICDEVADWLRDGESQVEKELYQRLSDELRRLKNPRYCSNCNFGWHILPPPNIDGTEDDDRAGIITMCTECDIYGTDGDASVAAEHDARMMRNFLVSAVDKFGHDIDNDLPLSGAETVDWVVDFVRAIRDAFRL